MTREQKIEHLKQLAAGKLSPVELLEQLPKRKMLRIMSRKDGLFDGLTMEQIREQARQEPLTELLIIRPRSMNRHHESQLTDGNNDNTLVNKINV